MVPTSCPPPPSRSWSAGSAYFSRVGFKNPRPWFRGIRTPTGFINLVTRLRTGHVWNGEHFARMGWDLDADCGCGAESRSLKHLFLNCPFLSEGRPRFFGFFACRFPGLPPDQFDYRELVFDPDSSVVSELGRFFKHGNFIIWFFRDFGCWGLPLVLGSLLSPVPMRRDRAGLTTWDTSCFAGAEYGFLLPASICWFLLAAYHLALLLILHWSHYRHDIIYQTNQRRRRQRLWNRLARWWEQFLGMRTESSPLIT